MSIDVREDKMQHAELFGKPVLYTNWLIARDTVPKGWYCYDIRGTDRDPSKKVSLEDHVSVNHAGSILSPVPLKGADTKARQIRGRFFFHGEEMDLETFCEEHDLEHPADTRKYILRPASKEEAGLFYSQTETEMAQPGQGQFGLTEAGRRMLQNAAAPDLPHTYEWYVIENIRSGAGRVDYQLPLDEAIELYAKLDSADKRLGVTKDSIAAVDLVICVDGREWFSEDWEKSASFAKDPVVTEALRQMRQALGKPEQGMTMGGMSQ